MTLTTFTISDRRRLQHYLNLPIQAVRAGSSLWQALVFVEQLDSDEGTTIAQDVQGRLDILETLDSVSGDSGSLIDAIQDSSSAIKSYEARDDIKVEYFQGGVTVSAGKFTGTAGSLDAYRTRLIQDIRRDIGFSQQSGANQLNVVYPGGNTLGRQISPAIGGRFY